MIYWSSAALAYLVIAFAGSAMLVRYAPRHVFARQLRRRLWLFPAAPLLSILAGLGFALAPVRRVRRWLVSLFEALSGRRQRVRYRFTPYGYGQDGRSATSGRAASDR
jgi:hypothetical protein